MNAKKSIDLSCGVPRFIEVFRLTTAHMGLRKGTLLVRRFPWVYFTIPGWYSERGKEYPLVASEEESGLVEFVDYYQHAGKRITDKYLPDLKKSLDK